MRKHLVVAAACALSMSCGTFRNFYNDTDIAETVGAAETIFRNW